MNKKLLIAALVIMLLSVSFVSARYCNTNDVLGGLRKALYAYYVNPSGSGFTPNELKSLLSFYVGIQSGQITIDCTSQSDNIDKAGALADNIPSCSDGTKYGKCSNNRPMYCYAGSLVPRCRLCGCPNGEWCDVTYVYTEKGNKGRWGKCYSGSDVVCSIDSDCGTSGYTGNYFCQNNDVYRLYDQYSCFNPGDTNSSCTNETNVVLVDDCQAGEMCVVGQGSCQAINETCSDGTPYNECSTTKPKYCDNGVLIDNCQVCGCDSYQACATNNGTCIACWDSDGGIDYTVKGYGTGIYGGAIPGYHTICVDEGNGVVSCEGFYEPGASTYIDDCIPNAAAGEYIQLNEAFCGEDGILHVTSTNCKYGCDNLLAICYCGKDERSSCEYGCDTDLNICKETIANQTQPEWCVDSDNGIYPYTKGFTANNWQNGSSANISDECVGNYIYERYCSGIYIYDEVIECENGCSNGACINETTTCTDSDGGIDYYVKGNVTGITKDGDAYEREDVCQKDLYPDNPNLLNTIEERYCSVGTFGTYHYVCPNGCQDGVCVSGATVCSDGTSYGQCSTTKPKYCANGTFVDNCEICGCDNGSCQSGSCVGGVYTECQATPTKYYYTTFRPWSQSQGDSACNSQLNGGGWEWAIRSKDVLNGILPGWTLQDNAIIAGGSTCYDWRSTPSNIVPPQTISCTWSYIQNRFGALSSVGFTCPGVCPERQTRVKRYNPGYDAWSAFQGYYTIEASWSGSWEDFSISCGYTRTCNGTTFIDWGSGDCNPGCGWAPLICCR